MERREKEQERGQPGPRPRSTSSVTFSTQNRLLGSPTGAGTLQPSPTSPRLVTTPIRTPQSVIPLRPVDLGLSAADAGARRHRVSASLGVFEQGGAGAIRARGPVSPSSPQRTESMSPQLFAARSRSNSIPESAKLAFEPAVGAVVEEDDDSDDEDLAAGEEVYDWCALATAEGLTQGTASSSNTPKVDSACPSPSSVVVLGSALLLASAAAAPQAERPSYRPPAITIGSPIRDLGRSTEQPSPLDAAEASSSSKGKGIMDSTGQRIITAATPRAPPPTPDSIGSAGSHWRSDSIWSLGSTGTLDGGGESGPGSFASVKDTHQVVRRKASLPIAEQQPVSGACFRQHSMINQYILLDLLGTGSYGEVRLCQDTTTEGLCAMKIVKKDTVIRFTPTPPVTEPSAMSEPSAGPDPSAPPPLTPRSRYHQHYEQLQTEINVMKRLSHPNVLRLVEVLDDPKASKTYLVLEYMKRGDLLRVLHGDPKSSTCEPLGDHETWALVRQVAAGLHYLHQQGVVHGDIKPQNLLVADDGTVKLADFGMAKIAGHGERLLGSGGTPAFQAPEVCAGERYDGHAADVWSLGATIFMVRIGRPPFVADGVLELFTQIIHEPVVFPADVGMCDGLHRLLEGMLRKDPSQRWTVAQIVADPWLQKEWVETSAAGSPPPPQQRDNGVCPGHSVSRCAFDPVMEAGGRGASS